MTKFAFDGKEMNVLLISLIQRRNTVLDLLNVKTSVASYTDAYAEELATVEGLMEKFFPGGLERIQKLT